jgi:AbrB family looped-hinge helix DNA binding protein
MSSVKRAVVNARGQIVIPASIRARFDIKPGTRIAFVQSDGYLVMQPTTNAFIRSMRGSLRECGLRPQLQRDPDRFLA